MTLLQTYRDLIIEQDKVEERATRLVELQTQLEPYQGQLLAKLSHQVQPYNGRRHFNCSPVSVSLKTGLLSQLAYQKEKYGDKQETIHIPGEFYSWFLLSSFGPFTVEGEEGTSIDFDSEILDPNNSDLGLLLWNKKTPPIVGSEDIELSQAYIIGDQAVLNLFGIKVKDDITQYRDRTNFYRAFLESHDIAPEELLKKWQPTIQRAELHKEIFRPQAKSKFNFQKELDTIVLSFFNKRIHSDYGVPSFEEMFGGVDDF